MYVPQEYFLTYNHKFLKKKIYGPPYLRYSDKLNVTMGVSY